MWRCLRLVIFYLALQKATCANARENELKILDSILSPGRYDPRLRPSGENHTSGQPDPTRVVVDVFIRSILSVDDVKMQYKMQLILRQQWLDERLKYDDESGRLKYLTVTSAGALWAPDLFFSNEEESHFHDTMTPNFYFRVFPSGHVLYNRRVSLTLNCPMSFRSYPMDEQVCVMRMASYAYSKENIVYSWKEYDPVQVVRSLMLPNFFLKKFETNDCENSSNSAYSCIKVDFVFKRQLFHHLFRIYVPSWLMVLMSWSSFWIDPAAIAARLMLNVSSLMVLVLQTSFVIGSLPSVPYEAPINVWMGACLTFALVALLETCTVHYVSRHGIAPQNANDGDALLSKPVCKSKVARIKEFFRTWPSRDDVKPKSIDVIARISFTVLSVIFNVIYWIAYAMK